jgi:hypothetical protein
MMHESLDMVRNLANPEMRLWKSISPLPFALDWFWWLRPSPNTEEPPPNSEECLSSLARLLVDRISTAAADMPPYAVWPEDAP